MLKAETMNNMMRDEHDCVNGFIEVEPRGSSNIARNWYERTFQILFQFLNCTFKYLIKKNISYVLILAKITF